MTLRDLWLVGLLCLSLAAAGCGSGGDAGGDAGPDAQADAGDGGNGFTPPAYGEWIKYEPEGAVCSNGSQYKFFINFSETSDNVVVFFEGGGGCWDYPSCTGQAGIRGAANLNGLDDDHADVLFSIMGFDVGAESVYPLLNNDPDVNPMAAWNKVFVPYCTGDVFSGSTTVTYEDPEGKGPDVEFQHMGHANVMSIIDMMNGMFTGIPRLFVGGCSAGGAGAIINYHFLRSGLNNVGKGYLLDDSGPIYPDRAKTSRSLPLHNMVRESWEVDDLINTGPEPETLLADFGNLNTVLAAEYPDDRLAITYFRLDYNYSLYSYERFYEFDGKAIVPYVGDGVGLDQNDALDRASVYSLWWDDTALLTDQYDGVDNLGYYLPFYRTTNSSHCATIPGLEEFDIGEALNLFLTDFGTLAWAGTEIGEGEDEMNLRNYVEHLLDDEAPLQSFFEEEGMGRYQSCAPDFYDAKACDNAVNPPPK